MTRDERFRADGTARGDDDRHPGLGRRSVLRAVAGAPMFGLPRGRPSMGLPAGDVAAQLGAPGGDGGPSGEISTAALSSTLAENVEFRTRLAPDNAARDGAFVAAGAAARCRHDAASAVDVAHNVVTFRDSWTEEEINDLGDLTARTGWQWVPDGGGDEAAFRSAASRRAYHAAARSMVRYVKDYELDGDEAVLGGWKPARTTIEGESISPISRMARHGSDLLAIVPPEIDDEAAAAASMTAFGFHGSIRTTFRVTDDGIEEVPNEGSDATSASKTKVAGIGAFAVGGSGAESGVGAENGIGNGNGAGTSGSPRDVADEPTLLEWWAAETPEVLIDDLALPGGAIADWETVLAESAAEDGGDDTEAREAIERRFERIFELLEASGDLIPPVTGVKIPRFTIEYGGDEVAVTDQPIRVAGSRLDVRGLGLPPPTTLDERTEDDVWQTDLSFDVPDPSEGPSRTSASHAVRILPTTDAPGHVPTVTYVDFGFPGQPLATSGDDPVALESILPEHEEAVATSFRFAYVVEETLEAALTRAAGEPGRFRSFVEGLDPGEEFGFEATVEGNDLAQAYAHDDGSIKPWQATWVAGTWTGNVHRIPGPLLGTVRNARARVRVRTPDQPDQPDDVWWVAFDDRGRIGALRHDDGPHDLEVTVDRSTARQLIRTPTRSNLERAIDDGDIDWHGVGFFNLVKFGALKVGYRIMRWVGGLFGGAGGGGLAN